jgi:hypothetical protein
MPVVAIRAVDDVGNGIWLPQPTNQAVSTDDRPLLALADRSRMVSPANETGFSLYA